MSTAISRLAASIRAKPATGSEERMKGPIALDERRLSQKGRYVRTRHANMGRTPDVAGPA
jgi:hypothetical protein